MMKVDAVREMRFRKVERAMFAKQLAGASDYDVRRITWQNAAELFRHPVPQSVIDDPESYGTDAR
jgi:hypothetical protein